MEMPLEQRKAQLTERIIAAVQELPEERVAEVLDVASYLRAKHDQQMPRRGSAETLLHLLDNGGALQFAPGELDTILDEIDRARDTARDMNG